MSNELPKALVLRLDSRMTALLNLAFGCANELAHGRPESAVVLARALVDVADRYPAEIGRLGGSISALSDLVPPEIMSEMGLTVMSPNELAYWVARDR